MTEPNGTAPQQPQPPQQPQWAPPGTYPQGAGQPGAPVPPPPSGQPSVRPGAQPWSQPPQPGTMPSGQPAHVRIHAHQIGSFGLSMTPAKVAVDGVERSLNIGQNDLLLTPGRHHLETWAVWTFGPFGRAVYDADLAPGQSLELHWNLPAAAWIRRSELSPERGKTPGVGCLVGVLVGVLLFIVLITVLAIILGSN